MLSSRLLTKLEKFASIDCMVVRFPLASKTCKGYDVMVKLSAWFKLSREVKGCLNWWAVVPRASLILSHFWRLWCPLPPCQWSQLLTQETERYLS